MIKWYRTIHCRSTFFIVSNSCQGRQWKMEHSRQMSSDVAAFFAYSNHADVVNLPPNYMQIIVFSIHNITHKLCDSLWLWKSWDWHALIWHMKRTHGCTCGFVHVVMFIRDEHSILPMANTHNGCCCDIWSSLGQTTIHAKCEGTFTENWRMRIPGWFQDVSHWNFTFATLYDLTISLFTTVRKLHKYRTWYWIKHLYWYQGQGDSHTWW